MAKPTRDPLTAFHWGTYRVETRDGRPTALRPFEHDPDPSPIGPGILDVLDGPLRIRAPMVRASWLENGPGPSDRRGAGEFAEVSWARAESLVADELNRLRRDHGNRAIFAGSYGWASAGRFHHAQSQLKRFLNCIGGFTRSVNTYSFAAAEVMVPHVLGDFRSLVYGATSWRSIIAETDLFVAFGGVPLKNGQIAQGGLGRHRAGGDAGPDRPARRRHRVRLFRRQRGRSGYRAAADRRFAAGAKPGRRFHSGGADCRSAAASRRQLRL